eukprot:433308-Heterocapsa_arctica.AAC.1
MAARAAETQATKEGLVMVEAECAEAAAKRESKRLAGAAATAPDDAPRSIKRKRKHTGMERTDVAEASHKALCLSCFCNVVANIVMLLTCACHALAMLLP